MAIISSNEWNTLSLSAYNEYYTPVVSTDGYADLLYNFGVEASTGILEYDITFENKGQQIFNTAADDQAWLFIDGRFQGIFGNKSQSFLLITKDYYEENSVHRIQIIANNTDPKTAIYVAADWYDYKYDPVNIKSFFASPNPLYGINGTPTSTLTLNWEVSNYKKIEINQGIGDVTSSQTGFATIDTQLKSIVPSRSPATKTYTLYAYGFLDTDVVEQNLIVQVFNDNTPNDFSIPASGFTSSFIDREPNQVIIHNLGTIRGIDMNTRVVCSDGLQATTSINPESSASNWSSNFLMEPNKNLSIRFRTPPLNLDPEGLPNVVEYFLEIGTIRKYFTVSTRSPYTDESFDFQDNSEVYPYPKLHTTPLPIPEPYIVSNLPSSESLIIDDTDLSNVDTGLTSGGIEIKTTLNDAVEVRFKRNFDGWSEWTHPNQMYDSFTSQNPRTLELMDMDYLIDRSNQTVTNNKPKEINTRNSGKLFAKNIDVF
jgi:hypothetical protein